jgi:nickel transport protein
MEVEVDPMKPRRLSFVIAIFLLFLSSPLSSWGHKVNLFAWVEGDKIFTDSFFSDGKKAVHSRIEVFDSSGKRLLVGKTDKEGMFSFKLPQKADLNIVLNASMGHRAVFKLPYREMAGVEEAGKNRATEKDTSIPAVPCMSKEEIRSLMEEILDQKLRPIHKRLVETERKGAGLTDILGGIGYILGMIGVAIYFSHRKKPQSKR